MTRIQDGDNQARSSAFPGEIFKLGIGDQTQVVNKPVLTLNDLATGLLNAGIAETKGATSTIILEAEKSFVVNYKPGVIASEGPGLVLCGKQAIDNDMNATGQMLSALLGWSQATYASELAVEGDHVLVTREVDGGLQTIKSKMPAIVSVDLRLNEPRYASLPGIIKAKRKKIERMSPEDLGVDTANRVNVLAYEAPPERAAGQVVETVDELVDKLRNEAKVF